MYLQIREEEQANDRRRKKGTKKYGEKQHTYKIFITAYQYTHKKKHRNKQANKQINNILVG